MKTGKELYEEHKGKKAHYLGTTGEVIGYSEAGSEEDAMLLLMSIPESTREKVLEEGDTIVNNNFHNKPYYYISERNVIM